MANQAANAVATVVLSEAAERQQTVSIELGEAALPRLSALVEEAARDAVGGDQIALELTASFAFDTHQRPRFTAVAVRITGQCALPCQRCLELVPVDIDIDTRLAVGGALEDDVLEALETAYERWDHEDDTLELADLADERIVLDLPLVVVHERLEDCGPLAGQLAEAPEASGSQTPFAGLQDLLAGKDRQDT